MATGGDDIDTTGGDDISTDLLSVPFSRLPFNEKIVKDIVKKGCPMPEHLELNQCAPFLGQKLGTIHLAHRLGGWNSFLLLVFLQCCISLNWLHYVSTHLLNDCS